VLSMSHSLVESRFVLNVADSPVESTPVQICDYCYNGPVYSEVHWNPLESTGVHWSPCGLCGGG
jgi:hypothetical protein